MQYSNTKRKGARSFYIVTAFCLIAIALTTYIAVKKDKTDEKDTKTKDNTVITDKNEPYNDKGSENDNIVTEPTETKAEDVPYTKPAEEQADKKAEETQTFILPVKGTIIKNYSEDTLQYDKTFSDMRLHKAIDISCKENEQIVSASSGTVTNAIESAEFNNIVTVDHGNGYTVEYCGLGTVAVKKGQKLNAGDTLGTAKNPPCECLDECHIHLVCLKDGVAFDPMTLYKKAN